MSDLNNVVASDSENIVETVVPVETANPVETLNGKRDKDGLLLETDAANAKESVKFIPFATIRCDHDRNPRKKKAYLPENVNTLARSIYKYGLQDAIVVSQRANGERWTVKGHRRIAAIELIHNGIPAIVNAKGKELEAAIPADPDKFKMVKCRVLTGMTYQDELDMLMDHAEVVGLDPQEKYLTAEILTRNGFTHEFIAAKLGVSRSNYSNFLGRLVVMPSFVSEAYMSEDESVKAPTQDLLKKLYPIYQKEQKLPGARIKMAGSELIAAWEEFQGGTKNPAPKMIPRAQLVTQVGTVKDSDIRDLLQAITDNAPMDLGNAITRLEMRLSETVSE